MGGRVEVESRSPSSEQIDPVPIWAFRKNGTERLTREDMGMPPEKDPEPVNPEITAKDQMEYWPLGGLGPRLDHPA